MSDLHPVVAAAVREHTPSLVPPFSEVLRRKRRRDRRRAAGLAMSGAVLSVVAVAGGSVLLADRPPAAMDVAGAAEAPVVIEVRPADEQALDEPRLGTGLDACLELPGTTVAAAFTSTPATYRVVTTDAAALQACVAAVPGYAAELSDRPLLPAPLTADGASICAGSCVRIDAEAARLLAIALLEAEPFPRDQAVCTALGPTYRVVFEDDTGRELSGIRVPTICGPLEVVDRQFFTVPPAAVAQIQGRYAAGGGQGAVSCAGQVLATTAQRSHVLSPDAEVVLQVAVGERVTVRGSGGCGKQVSASADGVAVGEDGTLTATRAGRYVLSFGHSACAELQDPTCRGPRVSVGTLVLVAS